MSYRIRYDSVSERRTEVASGLCGERIGRRDRRRELTGSEGVEGAQAGEY